MTHQAFQPGDLAKDLGIPGEFDFEGQQNLITGLGVSILGGSILGGHTQIWKVRLWGN